MGKSLYPVACSFLICERTKLESPEVSFILRLYEARMLRKTKKNTDKKKNIRRKSKEYKRANMKKSFYFLQIVNKNSNHL